VKEVDVGLRLHYTKKMVEIARWKMKNVGCRQHVVQVGNVNRPPRCLSLKATPDMEAASFETAVGLSHAVVAKWAELWLLCYLVI